MQIYLIRHDLNFYAHAVYVIYLKEFYRYSLIILTFQYIVHVSITPRAVSECSAT